VRWLLLVGFLSACGDNVAAVSFDSYASRRRAAECERQVRCGLFATLDECEAYTFLIPDQNLEAAIADHRVTYSELQALRCIDALAKRTCDEGTREARFEPDACAHVFLGTIATGASCAIASECATGRCMQPACDPSTCCAGTCATAALSPIGGACALDADCTSDAACGLDHACHALGNDGDTCYRDSQCNDGLGCVTQTNPGLCRPLAANAAACPYGICAPIGQHCDAHMTCARDGLSGDACDRNADCAPTNFCDTTRGVCAALPAAGMPCTVRCTGDAWCDVAASLCRPRLEKAAPCGTDSQCLTGYCAEGAAYDYCADRPVCD